MLEKRSFQKSAQKWNESKYVAQKLCISVAKFRPISITRITEERFTSCRLQHAIQHADYVLRKLFFS